MKRKTLFLLLLLAFFSLPATGVYKRALTTPNASKDEVHDVNNEQKIAGNSAELELGNNIVIVKNTSDERIIKLEQFLKYHSSPLAEHAEFIVNTADKYGLDWRWVVAISGVESAFGKNIPYNSYNAYGWGNGKIYFDSWEDSIETVSKTLKERYVNRGADTIAKVGPIYAPPTPSWSNKVSFFINKIDAFAPLTSKNLAFAL